VKLNSTWFLAFAAALVLPATAFAQNYQPIEGRVRESIPAAPFLASAYGFIWLAVIVYVVLLARRLTRVQGDMDELRRRLERDARG
jgi:hypothetical protein